MDERPVDGDVKKCPRCGHLAFTFEKQTLTAVKVTIPPGAILQKDMYERQWACSSCGHLERPAP